MLIPADLEQEKILATGAYGTNIVAIKGNYDAVNRLCTELSGGAPVGVRQRQPAALLRRGLEDARVRDRRAARLGAAGPRRRADRLRLAVHEGRARLPRSSSTPGCSTGEVPALQRRAGARLLAGRDRVRSRHRRLPPGQAGHDRQVAGDRQPGRRPVRDRARARHRRRDRQRHRRRDPRRHPAAGRDDRHLHRDRRRRHDRGAGQARRARRHRARTSASSPTSPATG